MASRNSRLRVRLTVLLRPRLLCFMCLLSGLQACSSTSQQDSCRESLDFTVSLSNFLDNCCLQQADLQYRAVALQGKDRD